MKEKKIFKVSAFIVSLVLMAMLSGCRANESGDTGVSEIEGSENENQEADSSSTDNAISPDEAYDGLTERVDNPDGGWTIIEYDEKGVEVRQAIYDEAGNLKQVNEYEIVVFGEDLPKEIYFDEDGKQIRSIVYNTDGSIKKITEYEYNDVGEQDKSIIYEYDTNGVLLNTTEYDGNRKRNMTVAYEYYENGSLKSISEFDRDHQTKIVSYRYNANGDLKSTSERIIGRKMVDTGDAESESAEKMAWQTETEHFIFYSTSQDIAVLDVIAETLEGCYSKVTSDLGIEPREKTKVYVSPSLEEHHKAIGRPNDPAWSVGEARGNDIYMVSPLNPGPEHDYDEMFDIAVHEFTHVVVHQYGGYPPSYLNEGIAGYESGQSEGTGYCVQSDMEAGSLPSLKEMAKWGAYVNLDDAGRAYAYGYIYIDFALEVNGYDTVISLLEGKTQTEAFGMNKEELNEKWMDFLASYVE